ncbi:hypothetical protein HZA75_04525 [Candidatus Roizmanbacteria bacterium]|nr:hypothetical protein [Candidatus Roizmanbacteria bacterium]
MKHKKIDLKYIFLSLLVIIVVAAAGYKYFEWSTLNSLATQYNKTWIDETQLSEALDKTSNEMEQSLAKTKEEGDISKKKDLKDQIDKTKSDLKLIVDQYEHYYDIVQADQKKFAQFASRTNLLFGKEKNFANDIIKFQLTYYERDLQETTDTLAGAHLLYDYFSVLQESLTLQEFQKNANGNEDYYADHLDEIAVLKKYTEENYQFPHQEKIKKYIPKGYSYLDKYKTFYATIYSVMEDYAKGDKESAQYKAGKLQDYAVALTSDPEELIKDVSNKSKKRIKDNVETIFKQTLLIKNFEKNAPSYPLLPKVKDYEANLVMCLAYLNKASSVYFDIMDTYPKSKNTNDLLRDLSIISPRTDEMDNMFDKKTLTITNNDKKITYVCNSKTGGKKFTFETFKHETK